MKKKFSALGQIGFILKFIARFLWETDKKSFLIVIFCNIIFSAVIIPNVLLDKYFLDTLISNINRPDPQAAFRTILFIVAARLVLKLFTSLAGRLSGYYARYLNWRQNQRLETLIGQKYATISVPTIEDPTFKDRYSRVERESVNRMQTVSNDFIRIPQYLSGLLSSLSIFVIGQAFVALIAVLSLIPTIIVERIFIKREYELDNTVRSKHRIRGMYYYYLGRGRSYMETRLLNVHPYLANKVWTIWSEIIDIKGKLIGQKRIWNYFADGIDDSISYSFDAVFAFQVIIGRITVGTAQAYIRAISSFKDNTSGLIAMVLELYENYLYLSDLVWFLELEDPYANPNGLKVKLPIKKGIEIDHIWFKYPGSENWILQDVSLSIKPNQRLALVGENGSGKTTLIKLLCGFYQPNKGKITLDGVDISKFNKQDYWRYLAVLFQDFEGYSVTAKESIAVGNIKELDNLDKVRKYAQMGDIDNWITNLPLNYENPLSRDFERGVSPSAGQWQRIGIARTLFKEAKIIVLDEPTSNVDPQAEEDIFNHILELGKHKTLVFISHRFSTVRLADKIFLLENGKLTEQGSHEELMDIKGKYAHLFNLQAKSYQ